VTGTDQHESKTPPPSRVSNRQRAEQIRTHSLRWLTHTRTNVHVRRQVVDDLSSRCLAVNNRNVCDIRMHETQKI
jgi:hypothetical protein